jgi:hypothetical protein
LDRTALQLPVQPMKRYLRYIALVAICSALFFNNSHTILTEQVSATPTSAIVASQPTSPTKIQNTVAPVKVASTTPVATAPVFDPNNSATWPTCPAGDIVRADNGQCSASAAGVISVSVATGTLPTGSHEELMAEAGIAASDFANADWTVSHESGWNPYAVEPTSGACHLGQELPCGKSGCAVTDEVCQLRWMNSYVLARYGSWSAEVAFHEENGYY